MRSQLRESVFQFLYLRETLAPFLTDYNIELPTLREEREMGYDARIWATGGVSTFYQFKRSDLRLKRNGRDATHSLLPDWWEFHLHSQAQHNLMHNLSIAGNAAVYVAPLFLDTPTMMHHAYANALRSNSIEIDPGPNGPVATKRHRYLYQDTTAALFRSDELGELQIQKEGTAVQRVVEQKPLPTRKVVAELVETTGDFLDKRSKKVSPEGPQAIGVIRTLFRKRGIVWCLLATPSRQ